ncbi:UNVERIFIED_ORG: hypothetical protein CLV66_101622 [Actinomadura viridilutea]
MRKRVRTAGLDRARGASSSLRMPEGVSWV